MATIKGTAARDRLVGTAAADLIFGRGNNDTLIGNAGNDKLDGGLGIDTMSGGLGNDTYIVDNVRDVVIEALGRGTDTVFASVNHTLRANVERLVLTGTALIGTGNALDNRITGNALANTLNGGAGADSLIGGLGNDTYIVDNARDVVVEALGQGTDTVRASVNHSLRANVENLILTGAAVRGTGNTLDNRITGNAGNNILDGGAGNDRLAGGLGNDTLIGGAGADAFNGGGGIDRVSYKTSEHEVRVNLAANSAEFGDAEGDTFFSIENIEGSNAAFGDRLVGNAVGNVIWGLEGSDNLYGGAGADTLIGGDGGDTLAPDTYDNETVTASDGAVDFIDGGNGHDTVNYQMVTDDIILNLRGAGFQATANIGGVAADKIINVENIYGGSGNDTLTVGFGATVHGGAGNDTLEIDSGGGFAYGGLGDDFLEGDSFVGSYYSDRLSGGEGLDTFIVHWPRDISGVDVIEDFNIFETIVISMSEFALQSGFELNATTLINTNLSIAGTRAHAQFIFEQNTQVLYFDQDGSGFAPPIAVVHLKNFNSGLASGQIDLIF